MNIWDNLISQKLLVRIVQLVQGFCSTLQDMWVTPWILGQVAFENTVDVLLLTVFLLHAWLHHFACSYFTVHIAESVAPTSLTLSQNDTVLCCFKWHNDLSGNSLKWYRGNEGYTVLLPTVALLQSSQLLLLVFRFGRVPWTLILTVGMVLWGGFLQEPSSAVRGQKAVILRSVSLGKLASPISCNASGHCSEKWNN